MFLSIDASGQLRQFQIAPGKTPLEAICEELEIKDSEDIEMYVPRYLTRALDIPCAVMVARKSDQEEQNAWNVNNIASVLWAWDKDDSVIYGKTVIAEGGYNGPLEQTTISFGETRNAVERLSRLMKILPFE